MVLSFYCSGGQPKFATIQELDKIFTVAGCLCNIEADLILAMTPNQFWTQKFLENFLSS